MSDIEKDVLDQLVERMTTSPGELTEASVGDARQRAVANDLELAAASAMLATLEPIREPLPESVRERVMQNADKFMQHNAADNVTTFKRRPPVTVTAHTTESSGNRWFSGLGWAAAATMLIALVVSRPDAQPDATTSVPVAAVTLPATAPSVDEARRQLISRPGSMIVPWGIPDAEGYNEVSGDVVWNNDEQRGYLRLVNMPANLPSDSQYQLWIVDPSRDANPVDGGVFDVIASNNEVLIPIDAKLDVISPAAFAITREQPGGVVVSAGPLLVVAAI